MVPSRTIYRWLAVLFVGILAAASSIACTGREINNLEGNDGSSRLELGEGPAPIPVRLSSTGEIRYAYMNAAGKIVLDNGYTYAYPFQGSGWAAVYEHERFALINRLGEEWYSSERGSLVGYEGQAVIVQDEGKYKLLQLDSGAVLLDTPDMLYAPREGTIRYAATTSSGKTKYGYYNYEGQPLFKAVFDYAEDFNEGYAVVKMEDGKYALIGKDGQVQAENSSGEVQWSGYGDGRIIIRQIEGDAGLSGYADASGRVIIAPKFIRAESFRSGTAIAATGDPVHYYYGVINSQGEAIIPFEYDYIGRIGKEWFMLGRFREADGKPIFTLATHGGRILANQAYAAINEDRNGNVYAFDGKRTFFLNENGMQDYQLPSFEGMATLSYDGRAVKADVFSRMAVLRADGKVIWREARAIRLGNGGMAREARFLEGTDRVIYYPILSGLPDGGVEKQLNEALQAEALQMLRNAVESAQQEGEAADAQPPGTGESGATDEETEYTGDFSLTYKQGPILGFELRGYAYFTATSHGMAYRRYMHVNTETGEIYSLADVLDKPVGMDGVAQLLRERIEERKASGYMPEAFTGLDEGRAFRLEEGAVVILFDPYEIAPYAEGFPEFSFTTEELDGWLNKNSSLWEENAGDS